MIPREIIDKILASADIVDVVGEFVQLRKSGANFKGNCPFHQEKTASFMVSPEKGIYKCFGCGEGGNAIQFFIKYHNLSFAEAAKELAKKYNISIVDENSASFNDFSRREAAIKALEYAADIYNKNLFANEGKTAFKYFQTRLISRETINKFQLGYSADDWNDLSRTLYDKGFSKDALIDAGLIIEHESGSFYDRFRGRAMFPIKDNLGKVIAFGARILAEDAKQAKYVNSPQSLLYNKSRALFGLFEAKHEIAKTGEVFLVEGYLDFLTLFQAGVQNAAASSGTALTSEQLDVLSRYAKKLFIVYDSDSAGVKAADRAVPLALEKNFNVRIVLLPKGDDPDSIVRTQGVSIFRRYVSDSMDFVDFKIKLFKERGMLESSTGQAESYRELITLIAKIPDKLQHDYYINIMADKLNLSRYQVEKLYYEKKQIEAAKKPSDNANSAPEQIFSAKDGGSAAAGDDNYSKDNYFPASQNVSEEEKFILQILLNQSETRKTLIEKFQISKSTFGSLISAEVFEALQSMIEEDLKVNAIMSSDAVSEPAKSLIGELSIADFSEHSDNDLDYRNKFEMGIAAALKKIEFNKVNAQLIELQSKIKSSPSTELMKEFQKLLKRKNELTNQILN